jgi:uncharacterized membrane protein YfcA
VALTMPIFAGVASFGVLVGGLSALLGVGGGLVMVPFMVLALDVTQQAAEGTSLLVIVPTAAVGALAHTRSGYVSFRAAALIAIGGIGGSYIGAAIALEVPSDTLEILFVIFVVLMGARLIANGIRSGKAEPGS